MNRPITAKTALLKISMLFLIPFFLFMFGLNVYSNTIYRQRLTENNQTRLTMFESFLEEDLKNVEYFMSDMIANDGGFNALRYPLSYVDSYLQVQQLQEKFESVMKTIDSISAFCIISPKSNITNGPFRKNVSYDEKENIKTYLNQLVKEKGDGAITDWRVQQIGEKYYFLKIMGLGGVYSSCIIDVGNVSTIEEIGSENSYLVFEENGEILSYQEQMKELGIRVQEGKTSYLTGSRRDQFVVMSYSEILNCCLMLVEPYRGIWSMESLPLIMLLLSVFFAILLLRCYRMLKRDFLNPLEQMVETMEQIGDDGLESRLCVRNQVKEYKKMESTFNAMMDRIKELKILAYVRLIQAQQTELQYYQIQIRPHFFLNCMKNLYAMTAARKYTQMQEMILTLSEYLRAVLKDHDMIVPLEKELDSVRSYVKLQQMSSARPPEYEEDVSPQLLQFGIPPMSLLTFVENSFKYEKSGEGSMQILIKARLFLDGEEKFVNITIMDNGKGFPEEVLEILNDPEKRMPGEHMGINNVEQRFSLVYQKPCSFVYSNMNGACVDIFIPFEEARRPTVNL
ncbi:Histidine kinase [Lachnospiraceae bacterium NLAE-zl-G231]|nr:Histidine kinase [Lachnospiraceae bacterium NLAE-zl-G231]